MALYHAKKPEYREALRKALGFQIRHLSWKSDGEIQQLFYHGHNTIRELVADTDIGVGIQERPVQVLLAWLSEMYHPADGLFSFSGMRPQNKLRKIGTGFERFHTYHLCEDDWLTYYALHIAINLHKYQAVV